MAKVNQKNLRGILAAIFRIDKKYIVPKQGNWYTPREDGCKTENWCAYRIKSNRPRTAPFGVPITEGKESKAVLKIAEIELQFVGKDAEEIAAGVAFWATREDIAEILKPYRASVLYEDYTAIPSDFLQGGLNDNVAWNIPSVKIAWYDIISAEKNPLMTIDIGGTITGGK